MEVGQEEPNQDQEGLAGDVDASLGSHDDNSDGGQPQKSEAPTDAPSNDSLSVQKRLKHQKRAHEREVRELHARISDMESRMTQPNMPQNQPVNPYGAHDVNSPVDEQIHKAVSYALQHKEMQERKAHEMQQQAHVQRSQQEMYKHLDSMGDKYDDFHDVVFGDHTPYTPAMRDYALTLPRNGSGSSGEVLYKLGKNPEELSRIAKLHPLDQASEMARLSHALISGGESKNAIAKPHLGNIKNNPVVNTQSITDKTSVGDLRRKMRSGWK